GIGAFSLVVPVTIAILAVLFFVTLSYLQVIGVYPRGGGSDPGSRAKLRPDIAPNAAPPPLVCSACHPAEHTSPGAAGPSAALPELARWTVVITVGVTLLMFYGNLRGIREAGRLFAFPTYFFVASLGIVVVTGLVKAALGLLHAQPVPPASVLGFAS